MRTLNTQELSAVTGAGKTAPNPAAAIDAITKALAAKGITVALSGTTLTITSPQGTKTFTLPAQLAAKLAALTGATAAA
jgi:hypothetical protein